ncbi:hypothetical protein GRJ2_000135100 [Grus japonensis]|uniref:ribonuclease H n=1 Tax=Grus japonensis TaxID=30415 RepID=A0ABC9VTE5_GRUJA
MNRGIRYLRELAAQEMVYYDLDSGQLPTDPDEVQCTQPMWQKFVQSTPLSYAKSLAVLAWKDEEAPTVNEVAGQLWQYEENILSSVWACVSAMEDCPKNPKSCPGKSSNSEEGVEKLSQEVWATQSGYVKFPTYVDQYLSYLGGWKHSPTICRGLIQTALEQGEAPEHLQYIDDIIVWRNSAEEVSEKGKKIVQILLKAGFAIKQSKVKGPAQEIQFLGIKWQDGCCQIPMDVINKIAAMSPPTSKKETQAFLGIVGFWRMHIPNYSLIVSPLYQVTQKKNDFKWIPGQRQAFEQIKQEIVHAVALGPIRA